MSYPAHDTGSPRAPARHGGGRRKRGALAVLAALLTLAAAIGCASIVPTFTRHAGGSGAGTGNAEAQQVLNKTVRGSSSALAPHGTTGLVTPPPRSSTPGRPGPRLPATPGGPSGLTSGGNALFGGDGPLVPQQGKLGRKLAIVRVYDYIGEPFHNYSVDALMASGTTLLVSLDTMPGGPSYASIAAGRQDASISAFLRQMDQAAVSYHLNAMYIDFEHEADVTSTHNQYGTPAEFIRAWDHVHALATSMHLDWNQGGRLHWVLILTHYAYLYSHQSVNWPGISAFWPGNSEVDIIGVDGYNTSTCRTARPGTDLIAPGTAMQTPAQLFSPTLSFARSHGNMPVFVAEWASVPYKTPSIQPEFIHMMQSYVTSSPSIGAALYWDAHGQGNGCDYVIDNRPASLAALATMGHAIGLQAGALQHG